MEAQISLRPLLLVEKQSARMRRARYSDPLILQKWTQAGMADISDPVPTEEDFEPPPYSAPPGGVLLQAGPTSIKPGVPVTNLDATDFAK